MHRVAELNLRGRHGPLPARVYWPEPVPGVRQRPLLVFFPCLDDTVDGVGRREQLCLRLCREAGIVVLSALYRSVRHRTESSATEDAVTVTQWAVDHAHTICADRDHVLVGGEELGATLAAAVAEHARENGWPPIRRQILIDPTPQATARLAVAGAGIAPATVITPARHDGDPTGSVVAQLVAVLRRSIESTGDAR